MKNHPSSPRFNLGLSAKIGLALLVAGAFAHQAGATTYTWTGTSGGILTAAANWSPSGPPGSTTVVDVAQWDGSVAGTLTGSFNSTFGGSGSSLGVTVNLTSGQVSNVTLTSANPNTVFRTADITVAAGAGALTLGASAGNSFSMVLMGAAGTTHNFTNNSSNTVSFVNTGSITTTGGNAEHLAFGGSGNFSIGWSILKVGSGTSNLTKSGSGILTLAGANNYSGTTTVTAGSLLINGNSSGATGVVLVNGGTLGGNGTIGGATSIANNATLSAGATAGSTALLTFSSNLTFSGTDSKAVFEIATGSRGTNYDAVDIGSLLTYNGDLTLSMGATIANGTYDLFGFSSQTGSFDTIALGGAGPYSGVLTNLSGVWTGTSGGQLFSFSQATGDLTVSSVPEPVTVSLFAVAGLFLFIFRRRVRRTA